MKKLYLVYYETSTERRQTFVGNGQPLPLRIDNMLSILIQRVESAFGYDSPRSVDTTRVFRTKPLPCAQLDHLVEYYNYNSITTIIIQTTAEYVDNWKYM